MIWKTIWNRGVMTPTKIVIHHTAISNSTDAMIESAHKSRSKWESISKLWSHIYYHITIAKDWTWKQHRKMDERSRATRANNNSINISFHGNFNEEMPTQEQYDTAKEVIRSIRKKYWELKVYGHGELKWEATACPGKNFSMNMLRLEWPIIDGKLQTNNENKWRLLWNYRLTQYYSPTPDQTYFAYNSTLWRRRTQKEEIMMQCGWRDNLTAEQNARSCQNPANWMTYIEEHKKYHGACPREFALETKLWIDAPGGWRVFTCVDRWWAINWNKLDIRAWYGNEWLLSIEQWRLWIPQYANVYLYNWQ